VAQLNEALVLLYSISSVFHHGDCLGADEKGAELAKLVGYYIVSHPPEDEKYRAFADSHEEWKEKPYLERNRDIVDNSDIIISVPRKVVTLKEILNCKNGTLRGGTYYTTRYALKSKKDVIMILPNGYFECGKAISNTEVEITYYGEILLGVIR
jgi:hypothetical protein